MSLDAGMQAAIDQARKSFDEGGVPVGAALTDASGAILGAGHNQRVQRDSMILHAEIDCLENVGRRASFRGTTLYSTLMPCNLCAGAIIQFKIPRLVVGESRTFAGAADHLRASGVEVIDLDLQECADLMERFIQRRPDIWNEDIGEE